MAPCSAKPTFRKKKTSTQTASRQKQQGERAATEVLQLAGVRLKTMSQDNAFDTDMKYKGILWYKRLNHLLKGHLEIASKYISCLQQIKNGNAILDCETCIKAKLIKILSKTVRYRYTAPLLIVHFDTMGPKSSCSYKSGYRYIVSFIDDY